MFFCEMLEIKNSQPMREFYVEKTLKSRYCTTVVYLRGFSVKIWIWVWMWKT